MDEQMLNKDCDSHGLSLFHVGVRAAGMSVTSTFAISQACKYSLYTTCDSKTEVGWLFQHPREHK